MRIPKPKEFFARRLAGAPPWAKGLINNLVAILQWVGIPAAVLSFIVDRQWVLSAAEWLYKQSGLLQPVLLWIAQVAVAFIDLWRLVYFPITSLFAVFNLHVPSWAFDIASVVILVLIGEVRFRLQYRRFRKGLEQALQRVAPPTAKGGDTTASLVATTIRMIVRRNRRLNPRLKRTRVLPIRPTEYEMARVVAEVQANAEPVEKGVRLPLITDFKESQERIQRQFAPAFDYALGVRKYFGRKTSRLRWTYGVAAALCVAVLAVDWYWSLSI